MKFILGIKPTILTGWGTTLAAKERVRESNGRAVLAYSSLFGYAYTDSFKGDMKYVYGYNIEVFKRGKHRHNKHFMIYLYKFPIEMFKLLNVEIQQKPRRFIIKPKK